MIVKLDKERAYTEDTEGMNVNIFCYNENGFDISPYRKEKVNFFISEKGLHFLDTLELYVRSYWDALGWYKKHKL